MDTLCSQQLTEDRFVKQAERTAREMGWGDTPGALGISAHFLAVTTDLVTSSKKYLKAREHGTEIAAMDDQLLALVGLTTGLSAVVEGHTLARLNVTMGAAIESECFAVGLANWDETRAAELTARVTRSHRNLQFRKTALRSLAQKANFPWTKWSPKDKGLAGRWLVEVMLESPVFTLDDEQRFTITQEAAEVSHTLVADLQKRHPVLLPSTACPDPWKATTSILHGYSVSLVRSRDALVQKTLRAAIRDGRMREPLEALNAAQSVSYRVNRPILAMVEWCYSQGLKVKGLPPRDDLPMPPRLNDEDALDEDRLAAVIKARRDIKTLNLSYLGERLALDQDVATARHLAGAPFWTVMNFDYRGRVYGVPRFNFQRQDYVRAMFEFDQGCDLTDDGVNWLKVHVANCGDFGKVSKKPFMERLDWFDANRDDIMDYANDPRQYLGWTEADKPFLFLAGCMAYRDFLEGLRDCHLPVSFDGTCSGLQHLGAMTRDENTAELVNLTNGEAPNDVYQVVAALAERTIRADLECPELRDVAQVCLDYGVNRSLVKRNVMTFSYSSKAFGMAEQHMDDTMVPLKYEVLAGKIERHPFLIPADTFETKKTGKSITVPGHTASRYLAKVVYAAIKQTVCRPADAMAFLQGIAKAVSHEGKPVMWHTPLGFPVVMRYPNVTTTRLKLTLHDKGVQLVVQPRIAVELAGIDKGKATSAIAPSFVHSLDGCHLQWTVLAASDAGITSLALVHDSFGCLPNVASEFRELIKLSFCEMYAGSDVLFDILRESAGQLDSNWQRLPDLPSKGNYDINSIMEADYAFA